MKLWVSTALTPYSNEYGLVAAVAETRDEAVSKIRAKLEAENTNYVPQQKYIRNLLEDLESTIQEIEDGVIVDWSPAEKRR